MMSRAIQQPPPSKLDLSRRQSRCGIKGKGTIVPIKASNGHALQGTSDGLREVQDAWRRQSTGPRTAEGLERIRKAQTTHGRRTAEMGRMRAMVRVLMAGAKRLVERS